MSVLLVEDSAAIAPALLGEERHGLCRRVPVGTLRDRSLEKEESIHSMLFLLFLY